MKQIKRRAYVQKRKWGLNSTTVENGHFQPTENPFNSYHINIKDSM